jgi:hypothetical protein
MAVGEGRGETFVCDVYSLGSGQSSAGLMRTRKPTSALNREKRLLCQKGNCKPCMILYDSGRSE